jgi:outer membrane receptor protein involved in Fe transport
MRPAQNFSRLTWLLGTTAWLGLAPALADEAARPQVAAASSTELQEVVVTAQKRVEDVKSVPESISVLSGTALTEQHVLDYQDIARTVPGVSFNVGNSVLGGTVGPGTTNVVIRGISSQSGSSTVALYMDDVSLTEGNIYNGAAEPKYLDIARVEIERGPQGTLFGASAMGGMIRLISNQPDLDRFENTVILDGSGTVHGSANTNNSFVTNIPIVEGKLAVRFAAQYGYDSGYISQYQQVSTPAMPVNNFTQAGPLVQSGINWEEWEVARLSAKYQASDTLSMTASVFAQYDHSGDTPVFYSDSGTYKTEKVVREPIEDKLIVPSLTVENSFQDFDLTSITSYLFRRFSFQTDGTVFNDVPFATAFVDGNLAGVPGFVPNTGADDTILAGTPSYVDRKNNTYQYSEELRATSKNATLFDHPLNWIFGGYVEWQRADRDDSQFSPGISQEFQNIYGFSINSPMSPVAPLYFPAYDKVSWYKDEIYWDRDWLDETQLAGFGQVDYNILPDLKATVGLRYLYSHLSYERQAGGIYEAGTLTNPLFLTQDGYAATPKFSLSYDVSAEDTVYATIAKGFRLGGPTGPASTNPCLALLASYGDTQPGGPTKYGADKLWSYEVGSKGRFLNNTLAVDVDAFYVDWSNIQTSIPLGGACGENVVQNAGSAESYGSEFELSARPLPGLKIGLNIGVTQATFTQTTPLLAGVVAVGEDIPDVPKFTITPSIDYGMDIGEGVSGVVHLDYTEVGHSHGTTLVSDPAYTQAAYGVMNANITMNMNGWQVEAYAKNLLNNSQIIARPTVNYNEEGYTLRPLTIGLQVSRNF